MSATAYVEMVDGGERSRRDEAQDQGGTRPSLNRLEDRTAALKNQLTKWSAVDFIFDTVRSKWYTVTSLAYVLAEFFYLTVLVPRDQLPQIFVFGSIWPSFYFCSLDYQLAHNYTSEQRATCSYTIQAFSFWVLIAYSIWVTCSEVLLILQVNNPKRSKLGWGMLALAYFGLYGFVWSSQTNNSVQLARSLPRSHPAHCLVQPNPPPLPLLALAHSPLRSTRPSVPFRSNTRCTFTSSGSSSSGSSTSSTIRVACCFIKQSMRRRPSPTRPSNTPGLRSRWTTRPYKR